jgi:hypothetical protein
MVREEVTRRRVVREEDAPDEIVEDETIVEDDF